MDVAFIDTPGRLDGWQEGRSPALLAMDTEFVRERTYFAQLGLVQVALDGAIALIDPLPDGSAAALARLLDRCPTIIMHSASEDLEALLVACQRLPQRLFDTQIAASLAGMGAGLSLQKLVEATVGVVLSKSETRTDWLRRPLSAAQLAYAADDVRHLQEAAEVIIERLQMLGRMEWAEQDCARLLSAAQSQTANPHPHLTFRPAQRLPAAAQVRVCRLLSWRDAEARRANKPRGWILDNSLLVRLADRPPASREGLDQLLDSTPGAPRKQREALWEELSRPATAEEQAMPLASDPGSAERAILKRLQEAVASLAITLELPEGVLAARRHLESLVLDQTWPTALEGWRRPLLEPAIGFAIR
ncbi:MAG: ribonuclease D [Pseudomarimonas sp.]